MLDAEKTSGTLSTQNAQQKLYNSLRDYDAIVREHGHEIAEAVIEKLQKNIDALVWRQMNPRKNEGQAAH